MLSEMNALNALPHYWAEACSAILVFLLSPLIY